MTSYEELVVDRHIDEAWKRFAGRLADGLERLEDEFNPFSFSPFDDAGSYAPDLDIDVVDGLITLEHSNAHDRALDLAKLGFVTNGPLMGIAFPVSHVDEAAHVACAVFRDVWGVIHPSLMSICTEDFALVDDLDVDEAPAHTPPVRSGIPSSHEEFLEWVDRTVEAHLGYEPQKGSDGSIAITSGDERLVIRPATDQPLLEVWSTVATGVDVRKARKAIAQMGASVYFLQFFLVGNDLVVGFSVNGSPYSPDHLIRAIKTVFQFLADDAPALRARVGHRATAEPASAKTLVHLTLLYSAVNEGNDGVDVTALAQSMTVGSLDSLRRIHSQAEIAEYEARTLAEGMEHGSTLNALIDSICTWRLIIVGLDQALNHAESSR